MVEVVLAAEAPVREDVLARRIARAHGWLRTGSRIRAQVARHLTGCERTQETGGDFIWRAGTVCEVLAFRRPEEGGSGRSLDGIPTAEIPFVARDMPGLRDEPDPSLVLARRLGIDRRGAPTRTRLQAIISRMRLSQ